MDSEMSAEYSVISKSKRINRAHAFGERVHGAQRAFRLVSHAVRLGFYLLTGACAFAQTPAEYRLSPGDVLEISIAGAPDLGRRMPVTFDGDASFPLIGEIRVAGLTLPELRTKVRDLIPAKGYKNRRFSGSEALDVIDRDEISLDVAEYRPLYVMGDISKPGEVKYRPGMTLKQAISVAGGYRAPIKDTEAAVLRRNLDSALVAFAVEKARIWRLMAMLGRTTEPFDASQAPGLDIKVVTRIAELQIEQMAAQKEDQRRQKEDLRTARVLADQRVTALATQLKNEQESVKLDTAEVERATELAKKGIVSANRLTEVHRTALLSATRTLQTDVAAEGAKKDRQEIDSKLQRVDNANRIDLLKELDVANAKAEEARLQVRSAREQLLASSQIPAEPPRISILRNDTPVANVMDATPLVPGDVIEIRAYPKCWSGDESTC